MLTGTCDISDRKAPNHGVGATERAGQLSSCWSNTLRGYDHDRTSPQSQSGSSADNADATGTPRTLLGLPATNFV